MLRIYARRIVAFVANEEAIGDGANVNYIGKAMGPVLHFSVGGESSVPGGRYVPRPLPASSIIWHRSDEPEEAGLNTCMHIYILPKIPLQWNSSALTLKDDAQRVDVDAVCLLHEVMQFVRVFGWQRVWSVSVNRHHVTHPFLDLP